MVPAVYVQCMSVCDLHASHLDERVFTEGQTGCHCCFTRTDSSSVSRYHKFEFIGRSVCAGQDSVINSIYILCL